MLLILTIPFLIAFYFLLIRPQQQRVREHEEMIAAITVGDRVVTAGGIHGTITAVLDDRVEIEVAPDLRLVFARAAIGRLQDDTVAFDLPGSPADADAEPEDPDPSSGEADDDRGDDPTTGGDTA